MPATYGACYLFTLEVTGRAIRVTFRVQAVNSAGPTSLGLPLSGSEGAELKGVLSSFGGSGTDLSQLLIATAQTHTDQIPSPPSPSSLLSCSPTPLSLSSQEMERRPGGRGEHQTDKFHGILEMERGTVASII